MSESSEYALECSVAIRPNNGPAVDDHEVRAILLAREMIGMAALAYQHQQGKREGVLHA